MNSQFYNYKFLIVAIIFLSLFSIKTALFFPYAYPRIKLAVLEKADDPLILTPFLDNSSIALAQHVSRVSLTDKIGFKSHAGFFTVDSAHNSNMYFWYFPPLSGNDKAPVILWLQGGPGASSLFGLFTEIGPLIAKKKGFALRKHNWALNNHLIFIDNPVGAGFSFTDKGYCNDEYCVARNLYNCLQQFFTMFPNIRSNEFFITGESYAGKYIPSLAMQIHKYNSEVGVKQINLKGLAMGNAYCDPINQIDYGTYLYQHGLLDNVQLRLFQDMQYRAIAQIEKENWLEAGLIMDKLMDGELSNFSYFKSYTGYNYFYNFLMTEDDEDMSIFADLLENSKVRNSIHVGRMPFNSGAEVELHLIYDILKSVAPAISELLSHYRVMFYNGQLDIIVAYPLTENFLRNLNFSSAEEYKMAPKQIWIVDDEIAGYVRKAGNLTEVLVRNAGHMVPHDQPEWALDLITRFIENRF